MLLFACVLNLKIMAYVGVQCNKRSSASEIARAKQLVTPHYQNKKGERYGGERAKWF
jgi:hypothetical protein